jgi:hypothetical protein
LDEDAEHLLNRRRRPFDRSRLSRSRGSTVFGGVVVFFVIFDEAGCVAQGQFGLVSFELFQAKSFEFGNSSLLEFLLLGAELLCSARRVTCDWV